mmetsp:Transcript_10862/g.33517  ORF Transcript_10862/g.33517 Transcript_10862/m.33517 type:complete len:105 (+) Transcript_10862:1395-1709(+)
MGWLAEPGVAKPVSGRPRLDTGLTHWSILDVGGRTIDVPGLGIALIVVSSNMRSVKPSLSRSQSSCQLFKLNVRHIKKTAASFIGRARNMSTQASEQREWSFLW